MGRRRARHGRLITRHFSIIATSLQMDKEVETLRHKVESLQKELRDSQEILSMVRHDGPPLEYVQNIVYKYLMTRDNLGKGAVVSAWTSRCLLNLILIFSPWFV